MLVELPDVVLVVVLLLDEVAVGGGFGLGVELVFDELFELP